jgi:Arc/MetJ-type ribon-helix-helix transcriptional regulator
MDQQDRITLRLERENLDRIDRFLEESKEFSNRSQLCRVAVQAYIEQLSQTSDQVRVRIPRHYLDLIDYLVREGYFLSREHAIVRCVEEFFDRERVREIEDHRREVGKATGKIVSVHVGDKDEVVPP